MANSVSVTTSESWFSRLLGSIALLLARGHKGRGSLAGSEA